MASYSDMKSRRTGKGSQVATKIETGFSPPVDAERDWLDELKCDSEIALSGRRISEIEMLVQEEDETYKELFKTTSKNLEALNLSSDLLSLVEGRRFRLSEDVKVPLDLRPHWLDMDKFRKGQKFAQDFYASISYAEMISLYFLFVHPEGLSALIITGKSSSPFKAFKRYLSTAERVRSWYFGDVWDSSSAAYKNLKIVKVLHSKVDKMLRSCKDLSKLTLEGSLVPYCPMSTHYKHVQQDFIGKTTDVTMYPLDMARSHFLDQWKMSFTQFGFMGLVVAYPEKFGITKATDEEMEAFVHFWRALGYLLGMKDEFNFCKGSLDEVRARCFETVDRIVIPSFAASSDWEHMSRCMTEGISYYMPGVKFESSLLYLFWVLGIDTPKFYKAMTWSQVFGFYMTRFVLCFFMRIPGVYAMQNRLIMKKMDRMLDMTGDSIENYRN